MIEAAMTLAKDTEVLAFRVQAEAHIGGDPKPLVIEFINGLSGRVPTRHWRPHRIDDDSLRDMAKRLSDLQSELLTELTKVLMNQIPDWDGVVRSTTNELFGLEPKIDLRMDELGW